MIITAPMGFVFFCGFVGGLLLGTWLYHRLYKNAYERYTEALHEQYKIAIERMKRYYEGISTKG